MPTPVRLRRGTPGERRLLRSKLRDLSLAARIHQRYRIIDEVHRGRPVLEAADRVGCHFTVAYAWVRRFNASGFATFERVPNPKGRPPILKAEQLRELVDVALSSPAERGLPFSVWSVPKLAEYCRQRRLLPAISDEWVRRLLRREGLTAQRIRTWKTSTDPAFDRKKLIRRLYRGCPAGAAVVCFDEWGPLDLKPLGGVAWAPRRRPQRRRATYRRPQGTEQFLGFYDVHADCLSGLFRKRKRVIDLEAAFRRVRACCPRQRLYVVLDNLHNVHDTRFLALLRRLRITPVWTPTEASWLKLIEVSRGTQFSPRVGRENSPAPRVRCVMWSPRPAG